MNWGGGAAFQVGVFHTWHQFATGSWSFFAILRPAVEVRGEGDSHQTLEDNGFRSTRLITPDPMILPAPAPSLYANF